MARAAPSTRRLTGASARSCSSGSGATDERIFGEGGRPEAGYRGDPEAAATLERLAASTGGKVWPLSRLDNAAAALRETVERGPTRSVRGARQSHGRSRRTRPRSRSR